MEPSIAGLVICGGIWLMALRFDYPLIVALMASFAFGSTAIVNLPALGGSSPLIYVMFAAALMASVLLRHNSLRELAAICSSRPAAWGVLFLAAYATAGAVLLPRIFAGETTVFVPQRVAGHGSIVETWLAPVSGNVTQLAYFLIALMTFFALSVLLRHRRAFGALKDGFFAWATVHVAMGFVDLFGRLAGLGDVLAPIRSASYAMLTNDDVGGFVRIAGGCSEASAFGAMSVSLLAFMFTYWRSTKNRYALVLSVLLLTLLILSTSSTAYVASMLLLIYLIASLSGSALADRLRQRDVALIVVAIALVAVLAGINLYDERTLDPFSRLFDAMVFNKASSASGLERAYWNWQSLQSLADTRGLGIGIGSSRASSWIIAVLSQFGLLGAVVLSLLTLEIVRGAGGACPEQDLPLRAVTNSVRAASLAGLLTASISGAEANPGLLFCVALAAATSLRQLTRGRGVTRGYGRSQEAIYDVPFRAGDGPISPGFPAP